LVRSTPHAWGIEMTTTFRRNGSNYTIYI
jgi:hypothetical protein